MAGIPMSSAGRGKGVQDGVEDFDGEGGGMTPEQIDEIREHQREFSEAATEHIAQLAAAKMRDDIDDLLDEIQRPTVKPKPEGPIARDLGIQHCGRKLFFVEGKSGVWCSHRDYQEDDTERVVAILDKHVKGLSRGKTLYHLRGLSAELTKVFREKEQT